MPSTTDGQTVPSVFDHQPGGTFSRLVVVSHRFQLERAGDDCLIATNDWLAWRQCLDQGRPAIHLEGLMAEWPAERGDADTFYQRHGAWMVEAGEDLTLFRGVSLGKQFNGHVVLLRHLAERLFHALDAACRRYRPQTIELLDLRTEYGLLNDAGKRLLVEAVAARNAIAFIDRLEAPPARPGLFADMESRAAPPPERGLKPLLRGAYVRLVDTATRLSAALRGRGPRVFVLLNWIGVRSLVRFHAGHPVTPVLQASQWPKTWSFVRQCLSKGVVLSRLPETTLDADDRRALDAIRDRLLARRPDPGDPLAAIEQAYVRDVLVAGGALEARARECRRFEAFVALNRLDRVLVGESANMVCRMVVDVARRRGAKADELLNGMFMTRQRVDTRAGDAWQTAAVDRLLAWGDQQERWAAAAGATYKVVRTGYPSLDMLRQATLPPAPPGGRKVLILPLTIDGHDLRGLYANTFTMTGRLVRGLRQRGYGPIKVKLHPGFPDLDYYREVALRDGLECEMIKSGSLDELVKWADVIIGPVNSGSFLETSALGRRYYPVRGLPSSLEPELFGGATVYDDAESVLAAVDSGDNSAGDPLAVLDAFCAWREIHCASARTWDVLAQES